MTLVQTFSSHSLWIFILLLFPFETIAQVPNVQDLLNKMKSAYAEVIDYQAAMEVKTYGNDNALETETFLYTFKKPKKIRLDLKSPHHGMVLVYPDRKGKVGVRPSGWASFIKLSLSPDSFLLKTPSGQSIDQTDLGLLIENISLSLTDERHGGPEIDEDEKFIHVQVLAENHFQKGILTRYEFIIDRVMWLPVGVREYTTEKVLQRQIIFRDLKVNIGINDSFFIME